jgi:hypothetical protein
MNYSIGPNKKLVNTFRPLYIVLSAIGGLFFYLGFIGLQESMAEGWGYNPIINMFLIGWLLLAGVIVFFGIKMAFTKSGDMSVEVKKRSK